jgi:hypothetical protein
VLIPWDFGSIAIRSVAAIAFWSFQLTGPGASTVFIDGTDIVADYLFTQKRFHIRGIAAVELVPSTWTPFLRRAPRLRIYLLDQSWVIEAETFASATEAFVEKLAICARAQGVREESRPLVRPRSHYIFDVVSVAIGCGLAAGFGRLNPFAFAVVVLYLGASTFRSWTQMARTMAQPECADSLGRWRSLLSRAPRP